MSEEELSIAFGDLTISVRRARPATLRSASPPEAQLQRSESPDSFVLVGEATPRGEDSGLDPRVTRAAAASSLLLASPAPATPSPRASAPSVRSLLAPGPRLSPGSFPLRVVHLRAAPALEQAEARLLRPPSRIVRSCSHLPLLRECQSIPCGSPDQKAILKQPPLCLFICEICVVIFEVAS